MDKNHKVYLEAHFRDHTFSDPNICMIRIQDEKGWKFFAGDIDDTLFWRTVKFGEIDTVYQDLDMNFKDHIQNIQKCNKNFKRKSN